MERRQLLHLLGSSAAASLLIPRDPNAWLHAARKAHDTLQTGTSARILSADELQLVGRIADDVLPRTDTPGATDVGVPAFIDLMLARWYVPADAASFRRGLRSINRAAWWHLSSSFAGLSESTRLAKLRQWDTDSAGSGAPAAFRTVKLLTVFGYFTSERVMKDVIRKPIIPGAYQPCVNLATARGT